MDETLTEKAVRLLRQHADELYVSHSIRGQWDASGSADAKAYHDELLLVARDLGRNESELTESGLIAKLKALRKENETLNLERSCSGLVYAVCLLAAFAMGAMMVSRFAPC